MWVIIHVWEAYEHGGGGISLSSGPTPEAAKQDAIKRLALFEKRCMVATLPFLCKEDPRCGYDASFPNDIALALGERSIFNSKLDG